MSSKITVRNSELPHWSISLLTCPLSWGDGSNCSLVLTVQYALRIETLCRCAQCTRSCIYVLYYIILYYIVLLYLEYDTTYAQCSCSHYLCSHCLCSQCLLCLHCLCSQCLCSQCLCSHCLYSQCLCCTVRITCFIICYIICHMCIACM